MKNALVGVLDIALKVCNANEWILHMTKLYRHVNVSNNFVSINVSMHVFTMSVNVPAEY